MSNGIGKRQNEEKSIAMLAAQRQLYSDVGALDSLNFVLSVILPVLFAILKECGTQWLWLKCLSCVLSIAMLFLSRLIVRTRKNKKSIAASIQLAFDLYVFQMPWDDKLFGKQENINPIVAEKSLKILKNENEKNKLINWYTPIVNDMPLEEGIFTCQKENHNWDTGIRKRYKTIAIVAITFIVTIFFVIGFVRNDPFQDWIITAVIILPMLIWLRDVICDLNDDIYRLKEMEHTINSVTNKSMDELQVLQKNITEHRKLALKIPNCFYKIFKNNDEDRQHRIASMDINM